MDNSINRIPPQVVPGQIQRSKTPPAEQPAAPLQAGDQVQLGSAPVPPPVTTTARPSNGVIAEYTRFQQGLVMRASLPAGHLLPVPLFINAFTDNQGQTTVRAARADHPEQELVAGRGGDGKIYVQIEEGAPLAVFSDKADDLSYGLAAPVQAGPGGAYLRPLTETVEADGSGRILVNEQLGPVDRQGRQTQTFTEITRDAEGLHAAQVEFKGRAGEAAPKETGVMGHGGRIEWQRTARDLGNGAIEVKNADAMTHMKNFYKAGWGWNLVSALNGPAPHVVVPFSAMNQADLFPRTTASAPATPPLPPTPPAPPESAVVSPPPLPPTPVPTAEPVMAEVVEPPAVAETVEPPPVTEPALPPAVAEVVEEPAPVAASEVPEPVAQESETQEPEAPVREEAAQPKQPAAESAPTSPQEADPQAVMGLLRQQSGAAEAALEEGFAQAGGTQADREAIQKQAAEQIMPGLKASAEQMGLNLSPEKLEAMASSQAMAMWADAKYGEIGGDQAQDKTAVQALAQVYQADQAFRAAETQLAQIELALSTQAG